MTIREDAGRLLKFLYDRYTRGNGIEIIESRIVYDGFEAWGADRVGRINRALNFLRDINAIKIKLLLGNYEGVYNFLITGLTNNGVELIERQDDFQIEFGFRLP